MLKTPGRLNTPPPEAEFDALPLERLCRKIGGRVFFRLHSSEPTTGLPWGPLHFGVAGKTRFDPAEGLGTLYLAHSLGGALMEIFNDRWGAVGSFGRRISFTELRQWWVTLVSLPSILLFDATGPGLSKLGTDAQLLSGDHSLSRDWALRLMRHPAGIGGIWFSSRHDPQRKNVALFRRDSVFPTHEDEQLKEENLKNWRRKPAHRGCLVHGPPVQLAVFSGLMEELRELEVALIP